MTRLIYPALYLLATVLANLAFARIMNDPSLDKYLLLADFMICFIFIGVDMGLRDRLHPLRPLRGGPATGARRSRRGVFICGRI